MNFNKFGIEINRIFNHLDEGVILVDGDDTIRWISEPGAEIFGRDVVKLLGAHIDEVFIKSTEINFLDETLMELKFPGIEDKQIYITFKYIPVESKAQGPWKAFIFRDISLMKDLEEELKKNRGDVNIITRSPRMKEILDLVLVVASSNATVLVQGESGTGKELIVNALHKNSQRKNRPLIRINCSAFPETLLEDELFGHMKGAFTGAYTDKKGRFEIADGGTIFLDEIGELSAHLQVKLLRVIQERSFERLGSNSTITVDIRIIAATNRDLKEEINKGNFREDLYYRLNVVPIYLPTLKERKEDIPLLVNHFLREFEKKGYERIKGVSSEVMDIFMIHEWHGNIREIENVIEYALVCKKGDIITIDSLPFDLRYCRKSDKSSLKNPFISLPGTKRKPYRKVSPEDCLRAIENCGGNKAIAARALGINRTTLYNKIKTLM